ncbi:hypothetical protein EDB84DRAFT_1564266 [Lactarius hengduanensis]|nr:hypothetical protein EDB84DRAFT_1564266 [Lactarius hengduanensis]
MSFDTTIPVIAIATPVCRVFAFAFATLMSHGRLPIAHTLRVYTGHPALKRQWPSHTPVSPPLACMQVIPVTAVGYGNLRLQQRSTDPAPATTFAHLGATTVLSRSISELSVYPTVDPLDSKSQMLVGEEHYEVATAVQKIHRDYGSLQDTLLPSWASSYPSLVPSPAATCRLSVLVRSSVSCRADQAMPAAFFGIATLVVF